MNIFIVSFVLAETYHRAFPNLRVISIAQGHKPKYYGSSCPQAQVLKGGRWRVPSIVQKCKRPIVNYIPMPDSWEIVITKASTSNGWLIVVDIRFVKYYLCNIRLFDIQVLT
jgi:hypothetical protein